MRYTNKQILKITYPVLISLLMEHMIGLTDTAYLGRVGEVELGASALAGVYYLVIYMLGFGFSVGAQVLMARRNGEGEYKRIGEVFTQGGLFLFLLAAVAFLLLLGRQGPAEPNVPRRPQLFGQTLHAVSDHRAYSLTGRHAEDVVPFPC